MLWIGAEQREVIAPLLHLPMPYPGETLESAAFAHPSGLMSYNGPVRNGVRYYDSIEHKPRLVSSPGGELWCSLRVPAGIDVQGLTVYCQALILLESSDQSLRWILSEPSTVTF